MKTPYIILILLFAVSLEAQWSNDPNNNLIIGYGADPHICSDSAGGCYITYNAGEPSELFLRRLDKYGYQPWGYKKQILGELEEQWNAEIIEDGEGGVIISYLDETINWPYFTDRVRVQKVDSAGNFLWGQTGKRVSLEITNHSGQKLVSDGDGGCVIAWGDWDGEISVNRINRYGERVWGDSGIVLAPEGTSLDIIRASDGSYYVQINSNLYRIRENGEKVWQDSVTLGYPVAAPDGGVVLSGRVWTGMIPKLVAQRKDTLGNNLWQEPYVEIADSLYINTHLSIQYNNGYYYYGWTGKKNGIDKVTQFQALRLDGSKLFSDGSIQVGNPPLNGTIIQPLEKNRTAFIYYNKDFLPDSLLVQVYDTLGNKIWAENGILIAHPPIESQSYTTDGNGGFIIGGTVNEFTIVAQQVSKYGNLGEIITNIISDENKEIENELTLSQNYPNPFNSSSTIEYSVPSDGNILIELYNTLGERIKTIINRFHNKGTYSVNILSNELPSGIYLYRLQSEYQSITKKLIMIK